MQETERIRELEDTVKKQKAYITELEKITEAYDNLEILTNQELQIADKTLKAHEVVEDLSRQERIEADKIIRAHEEVNELSRHEIIDADALIHARENLQHLTEIERKSAEEILKAQEQLKHLSAQELQERDLAIRSILRVTRQITRLMDTHSLLDLTLELVMDALKATRGVLFLKEGKKLIPKIVRNITFSDMRTKNFQNILSEIKESATIHQSKLKINKKFIENNLTKNISYVCLPLVYEENLLGLIYLDLVSNTETFKSHDLEIAEIFSTQAAISINNASLYEKIKNQNLEFLKLINLKGQIIEHISNEVQIPLKKIFTTLNNIIQKDEIGKDNRIGFLKDIHKSLNQLQERIKKVFTFQELERQVDDLFIDTIDFQELFSLILKKHEPSIIEKNLNISLEIPRTFGKYHGNQVIIRTIFDEVLSNAVFYNRKNGSVKITGRKENSHLIVEITDTGIGIPKQEQNSIFNQFYRISGSEDFNDRGAGLGLFMVKSFVSHYNGTIKVESTVGKGSTFTITLLEN